MKPILAGLLGDDSDRSWRWFGKHDAYCGVLGPDYEAALLTAERKREFFATGVVHVDHVLTTVSRHLDGCGRESCLDFGCGVGRLVVPFAAQFRRVTGIDISEPMIEEAKRNCADHSVHNVDFAGSLERLDRKYDLVHSYIVLQHIPVARGSQIIDRLIDCVAPGGVCFLHLTIGRNRGFWRDLATDMRKNIKPIHWTLNVLKGKPISQAYMQSNRYNLSRFVAHLYDRGVSRMWLETENHAGPYSVCVAFRVGVAKAGSDPAPSQRGGGTG